MPQLFAPPGKFRVVGTLEGAEEGYVVGDYATLHDARRAMGLVFVVDRSISMVVYDDTGAVQWTARTYPKET